tara:strand:+ start:50 stop:247 length:198 start_codon:yes stop_codon:yes gene_type:complete
MYSKISKNMILFLINEIGMDQSSIELGIKLSTKNNTPLPILLWSYGMVTIEELDKIYGYLFQIKH